MSRASRLLAAVMLVSALAASAADAQPRVLVIGTVQWTTSNRLQVFADTGVAVNVDVSRLDQSSYTSLRAGDRVRIIGVFSPDRRVMAESIEIDTWTIPQAG